jgi:hypothetical protein
MTRIVTCHCGAVYERSETRIVFRVSDDFACQECDEVLESWSGSRIPVVNDPLIMLLYSVSPRVKCELQRSVGNTLRTRCHDRHGRYGAVATSSPNCFCEMKCFTATMSIATIPRSPNQSEHATSAPLS